jgi:alanine racemase
VPHALARIDHAAIEKNIAIVRDRLPSGVKILFAVKSDAYGHGLEPVCRVAEAAGIDVLGTTTVEEGIRVRETGVELPILLLNPIHVSQAWEVLEYGLTPSVGEPEVVQALAQEARARGTIATVHVNVDTGMRRFGLEGSAAVSLLEMLRAEPGVTVEGVFTHLASAIPTKPEDLEQTREQLATFRAFLGRLRERGLLPPLRHAANSAGVIGYGASAADDELNMVRLGTLLYGYPEIAQSWTRAIVPVARLVTWIAALQDLAPGDTGGYRRSIRAPEGRRIAILPIGYGTGIPPRFSSGGTVLVRGALAPVVGEIGLDHLAIDVTAIGGVDLGEEVEVFGPNLPADQAAARIGLPVCQLLVPALRGAVRVER